jgi:hypothetical protein
MSALPRQTHLTDPLINGGKMKIWSILALASSIAVAQNFTILGSFTNSDGGQIVFTTVQAQCPEGERMVYTTEKGGKVGAYGCWKYAGGQFMVVWADGTVYSYGIDGFTFSAEAEKALNNK